MTEQTTNIRKTINYLIRAAIIIVTYGFIYRQVFVERKLQDIQKLWQDVSETTSTFSFLGLIVVMMLLNWGLESVKWRLLIAKIEKVSFLHAFMAVMTGISISIFTPNRTGDYLGRVFILKKGNHVEGILITIIGSFAQLIVTLCVGLFCFLTFMDQYLRTSYFINKYLFSGMILLIPLLVFFILLIYFNIGIVSDLIARYIPGKWEKLKRYAMVFKRFSSRELMSVLALSFIRYLVFSAQFFLLLRLFGASLPLSQALLLIPVIYLIMSVIPSVALTELGVRGSVSIFVIMMYFATTAAETGNTELAILAASTVLWAINLIIPAIIGTFFVFSLKFIRK